MFIGLGCKYGVAIHETTVVPQHTGFPVSTIGTQQDRSVLIGRVSLNEQTGFRFLELDSAGISSLRFLARYNLSVVRSYIH